MRVTLNFRAQGFGKLVVQLIRHNGESNAQSLEIDLEAGFAIRGVIGVQGLGHI